MKKQSINNEVTHVNGAAVSKSEGGLVDGKSRMTLTDFAFKDKHAAGVKMPILLPSGADSGETLTVRGPECDESVEANRIYTRALFVMEDELAGLKADAEARNNWFEYNIAKEDKTKQLNMAFISDVVTGWSLEEQFSRDNLINLLDQFPALIDQVSAFHIKLREDLQAK